MNEFSDLPAIEPGLYRHYKGTTYRVLGVGCNTEEHEYYVVYSPEILKENHPQIWLRPYVMFMETVDINGEKVPRFKKLME